MKILSYRRFALWWQLAMDWFRLQFAAIAASIDFTPVENKLDDVKSDVADVKTAVENIDIDTSDLAKEATLGTSSDTSVSTTIFGWLKSIRDFLVGIVTTNPYAKEATVAKQGTDPTATNTVIRDLVLQQGILYAQEYAAAINEIAGDWSENESEI